MGADPIQFAAKPWTDFEVTFRRGSDITRADGWEYWLPSRIKARCSGRSFGRRPEVDAVGLGGYLQAQLGSSRSPMPGRTGWIEHGPPPVPNT